MKSLPLDDSSQVQFDSIDMDLIKSLNEFTKVQLSLIPLTRIPAFLNPNNITARSFINKYQRNCLSKSSTQTFKPSQFYQVTNLYNSIVSIARSLKDNPESIEERYKLILGIFQKEQNIVDNYLNSFGDYYYVFGCLFELIFKGIKLSSVEREVLNYRLGYYRKYKTITQAELANKLQISKSEINRTEIALEKRIDNIIAKFKLFKPCILIGVYDTEDILGDHLNIRPDLCKSIREKEKLNIMSDIFIAKVISVICDYKLVVIDPGTRIFIRLIKPGINNSDIRFFDNLKRLLEPGERSPETKYLFDEIVEALVGSYHDYEEEGWEEYYGEAEYLEQEEFQEEEAYAEDGADEGSKQNNDDIYLSDPEDLDWEDN